MINKFFGRIADQIEVIYTMVLDDEGELFAVRPPEAPMPPRSALLMRTMAIDMSAGWLTDWFAKRFKKDAYVGKFEELCQAEMKETLKEMRATYIAAFEKEVRGVLYSFPTEHINTLQKLSLLGADDDRRNIQHKLGVDTEIRKRLAELERVVLDLEALFTRSDESEKQQSVA